MNQIKAKSNGQGGAPAIQARAATGLTGSGMAMEHSDVRMNAADDEIVIDIRAIIQRIAKYWRLVLTCTLVAALLGGIGVLVSPPPFEAVATVAIVKMRAEMLSDSKIKTTNPDSAATSSAQDRRTTLVAMALNGGIAQGIAKKFADRLLEEDREPSRLMTKITASIAQASRADLIEIKIRDRDPVLASDIANEYAREYEKKVNEIYAGSSGEFGNSLAAELSKAKNSYDKAQLEMEQFIIQSKANALARQIKDRQIVLDALQKGMQATVSQVVEQEVKLRTSQINDYQNALSQNQQVLFQHEQNAKRAMLQTLLQAESEGKLKTVSEQIQANQRRLSTMYANRVLLEKLTDDAKLLRETLRSGSGASAISNRIALQLLKVQVTNASAALPANLQLQFQTPESSDANSQTADLTALVDSLAQRVKQLDIQIAALSQDLTNTGGYEHSDAVAARIGSADIRTFANASPINADIAALYQSLYSLGSYSQIADTISKTNELSTKVQKRASELQQLTAEVLIPANGATEATILQIEKEVRELQAAIEQENVKQFRLTQARDLAKSNFTTLSVKQSEVEIGTTVIGSEVRVASPALTPSVRTSSRSIIVLIAAMVGMLLGILAALLLSWFQPVPQLRKYATSPLLRWFQQAIVPVAGTD